MDVLWAAAIGSVGGLFGIFFALNGFGERVKAEDLKNSTRVRNLVWLITGAAGVVFADWKKLAGTAPDSGFLLIFYILGAIAGAVLGLLSMVALITIDVVTSNRHRGTSPTLSATRFIMDYLTYGYGYYQQRRSGVEDEVVNERAKGEEKLQLALKALAEDLAVRAAQERFMRLQRYVHNQDVIAGLMYATNSLFDEADVDRGRERRNEIIELILKGLSTSVISQALGDIEHLEVRSYFMKFIRADVATPKQKAAALFRFGDENRYTGFLVLHQLAEETTHEAHVIPVDSRIADRERLLPGPSEAFALGRPTIMNSRSIKFRRQVDADVQQAFTRYCAETAVSVASIPVLTKFGFQGVIKIESNREDLLGEGDQIAKIVCEALQPFSALLSRLI